MYDAVVVPFVTLHVSVWVEICVWVCLFIRIYVTLHVSVWVEILNFFSQCLSTTVTLHVSVWVEIEFEEINGEKRLSHAPRERVSWNCNTCRKLRQGLCHAPRERVSWNFMPVPNFSMSTVTLHVSVWVEINVNLCDTIILQSRSTWACELKYGYIYTVLQIYLSRSTWACELK